MLLSGASLSASAYLSASNPASTSSSSRPSGSKVEAFRKNLRDVQAFRRRQASLRRFDGDSSRHIVLTLGRHQEPLHREPRSRTWAFHSSEISSIHPTSLRSRLGRRTTFHEPELSLFHLRLSIGTGHHRPRADSTVVTKRCHGGQRRRSGRRDRLDRGQQTGHGPLPGSGKGEIAGQWLCDAKVGSWATHQYTDVVGALDGFDYLAEVHPDSDWRPSRKAGIAQTSSSSSTRSRTLRESESVRRSRSLRSA